MNYSSIHSVFLFRNQLEFSMLQKDCQIPFDDSSSDRHHILFLKFTKCQMKFDDELSDGILWSFCHIENSTYLPVQVSPAHLCAQLQFGGCTLSQKRTVVFIYFLVWIQKFAHQNQRWAQVAIRDGDTLLETSCL